MENAAKDSQEARDALENLKSDEKKRRKAIEQLRDTVERLRRETREQPPEPNQREEKAQLVHNTGLSPR